MNEKLGESAQWLASRGLPVFPIIPKSKAPATKNGFYAATTDEKQIKEWWNYKDYEVAVAVPPGIIVVDFDANAHEHITSGGDMDLPNTWVTVTPGKGGGRHYWYRLPLGVLIPPMVKVMDGMDIRTENSYVLVPPSNHPDGGAYSWEDVGVVEDLHPTAFPWCPKWIVESCLSAKKENQKERLNLIAMLQGIEPGSRYVGLFRAACSMRARGFEQEEAEVILAGIAKSSEGKGYVKYPDVKKIVSGVWKRYEEGRRRDTGKMWTLPELLSADLGSVNWFVEDLLAPGLAIVYADEKVGKCISHSTQVLTEDRWYVPVADVKVGERVYSVDAVTGEQRIENVVESFPSGVKPMIRIKTNLGKEIVVSDDHPMLINGMSWVKAKDVVAGDFHGVARMVHSTTTRDKVSAEQAMVLGYLIGDGSLIGGINFFNEDGDIQRSFIESMSVGFPDCNVKLGRLRNKCQEYCISGKQWRKNSLREMLVAMDLIGKNSYSKSIPDEVCTSSDTVVAAFLNALFSCDGYVCVRKNKSVAMEYASNSERLVDQIIGLLLRFGVVGRKKKRKSNFDTTYFRIDITSQESISNFKSKIGFTGKKSKVIEQEIVTKPIPKIDVIPHKVLDSVGEVHADRIRSEFGILKSGGIGRDALLNYAVKNRIESAIPICSSDIYWDKVVSVEVVPEEPCWDLTVENTESMVANGFYIHNSGMMAQAALSLATREKVWGYFTVPKARGVLYLDLEQDTLMGQNRWRKILDGRTPPQNLRVQFEWPRMDDGGLEQMKEALQANPDIEIVVVDIFAMFMPLDTQKGSNAYYSEVEILDQLKKVSKEYGCLIVIVHHTNKDGDASGSRAMKGSPDYIFEIQREQGSRVGLANIKGKNIPPYKVLYDVDSMKFAWKVTSVE